MSFNKSDYYNIESPGDGDCFFHSIVGFNHLHDLKKKIGDKYYTYHLKDKGKAFWKNRSLNLRKACVSWMKKNLQKVVQGSPESIETSIQDAIENDENDNDENDSYEDIDDYLDKMEQSGEYAGQPEIYALSHILKRNIVTYVDDKNDKTKYKTYGGALSNIYDKSNNTPTIYLYHNISKTKYSGLHHFDILLPKKNTKIIKKDVYERSEGTPEPLYTIKPKPVTKSKPVTKKVSRRVSTRRQRVSTRRQRVSTRRQRDPIRRVSTRRQRDPIRRVSTRRQRDPKRRVSTRRQRNQRRRVSKRLKKS